MSEPLFNNLDALIADMGLGDPADCFSRPQSSPAERLATAALAVAVLAVALSAASLFRGLRA